MKTYKKLLSFGCSFTEGGGLNSQKFHRWLAHELNLPLDDGKGPHEMLLSEHQDYARSHSYPGYLARKLRCEFENFGCSGASNEYIFRKAYDEIIKLKDTAGVLVTIQGTMLSRMCLRPSEIDFTVHINNLEGCRGYLPDGNYLNKHIYDYYKLYLEFFYDEKKEYEELRRFVDYTSALCEQRGIDLAFLNYLEPGIEPFILSPCRVDLGYCLDLVSLWNFFPTATITQFTQGRFEDHHFSPDGNALIADLIYKHLEKTPQKRLRMI